MLADSLQNYFYSARKTGFQELMPLAMVGTILLDNSPIPRIFSVFDRYFKSMTENSWKASVISTFGADTNTFSTL